MPIHPLARRHPLAVAVSTALMTGSAVAQTLGIGTPPSVGLLPVQDGSYDANPAYADTFYSSPDYTYCDAKLLAALWQSSPWDAKLFAGWKMTIGNEGVIQQALAQSRNQFAAQEWEFCTYQDADNPPYTYDDAAVLAFYWGPQLAPTPGDAKLKIANSLFWGYNASLQADLDAAYAAYNQSQG